MTALGPCTVCVDIGNSGMRCVLVPHTSIPSPPLKTDTPWIGEVLRIDWPADQPSLDIPELIKQALIRWLPSQEDRPGFLVSSVQRTMEGHLKSVVLGADCAYRLVNHLDLNLSVQVDQPEKVGIDRLLAVLAAANHFPGQPLVVIQAGSAITVDWFEPPQSFCGGAIMPGVPMMLRLLSTAADLLPPVAAKELLNLPPLPGRNTTAAMNAGVSSAVVGGVQHLISRYRQQHGQHTLVVLSGGDGPLLSPHLLGPTEVIDHLVLRGLASLVGTL